MKIFIFSLAALICLGSEVLAIGGATTSLGFMGGYRYNNMNVAADQYNNRTFRATPGYQAGLALLIPIADGVALRFGALYSVRDMDFSTPINSPTATGRARLAYADLPAALQFTLSSRLYLWFGQMTGVKLSDTCDMGGVLGSCNSSTAAPLDLSSVIGFGWDIFDLGSTGKFSLEAQYEYGLNNIWPLYNTNTNSVILNAMMKFGL